MWIEEIFVGSFGAFRATRIGPLHPGLTVILGRNEAGKSTIVELVRSVFFGFKKKAGNSNIYESVHLLPRKGRLVVRTDTDRRLVVGRGERRGFRDGALTVADEHGNAAGPSSLPFLAAGMDRIAYESLYAFDAELMRKLDQDALRGKIAAAALGSLEVNPLDVMHDVSERLKNLARRSGNGSPSLHGVRTRLREVDRKLRSLEEKPARYSLLLEERAGMGQRRRELAAEIAETECGLGKLRPLLTLEEPWNRLQALDREADLLEPASLFPADGISRLEQALERRRDADALIREADQSLDHLRRRLAELIFDPVLGKHADSLRALSTEAGQMADLPEKIAKLSHEILEITTNLDEVLGELGPGWTRERVTESDPSYPVEKEIRGHADSLRDERDTVNNLRSRLADFEETCKRLHARVTAGDEELQRLLPLCDGLLEPQSLRRLQQWKVNIERITGLEGILTEKSSRLVACVTAAKEAETELIAHENRFKTSPTNRSLLLIVPAVALAGAGFIAWAGSGTELASAIMQVAGWMMIVASPLSAAAWKLIREPRRRARSVQIRDELVQKRERGSGEIALLEAERRALLHQLGLLRREQIETAREVLHDPQADLRGVIAAEMRSAAAEEPTRRRRVMEYALDSDRGDWEAAQGRLQEATRLHDEAIVSRKRIEGEWRAFLDRHGFDPDLDPATAQSLVIRLREAKATIHHLSEIETAQDSLSSRWEDFSVRVRELGAEMGHPVPSDRSPVEQVEYWLHLETEARHILSQRQSLSERIADREIFHDVSKKKRQDAEEAIAALIAAAGVADEELFRQRSLLHQRLSEVEHERGILLGGLASALATPDDETVRAILRKENWDELRNRERALRVQLERLRNESEEVATREGRLSREIETLEDEDETECLLMERAELIAGLNGLVREWLTLNLSRRLLEKTLRMYESEKQPKVLERGSEVFQALTRGAFAKVIFSLDENRVSVERTDGTIVPEELLSTGTLEQVYLSLRLAHVEVYHCGETIPLLLDDIFVNFDPDRARAAAECLESFSRRTNTQVLFFTCHPHIAELFPARCARRPLDASWSDETVHRTREVR